MAVAALRVFIASTDPARPPPEDLIASCISGSLVRVLLRISVKMSYGGTVQ